MCGYTGDPLEQTPWAGPGPWLHCSPYGSPLPQGRGHVHLQLSSLQVHQGHCSSVYPMYNHSQYSGSVTFLDGSESLELFSGLRIGILLFSSVTIEMLTNNIFPNFFAYYLLKVHLHQSSKITSHETVKSRFFFF